MRTVGLLVLCAALGGCYSLSLDTGKKPAAGPPAEMGGSHVLWGMTGDTVNVGNACPGGVARVATKRSFGDVLIGGLTFGLYQPVTVIVECEAK